MPSYDWLLTNTVLGVAGSVRVTLSASPAACGSAQPSVGSGTGSRSTTLRFTTYAVGGAAAFAFWRVSTQA